MYCKKKLKLKSKSKKNQITSAEWVHVKMVFLSEYNLTSAEWVHVKN